MKKHRILEELVSGLVGATAGAVIMYLSLADHSPYGIKTSLPKSFYAETAVKLGNLHPAILNAYLGGYATEDTVKQVLNGRLSNTEPINSTTR
ncbi:MAG: hypothetical protein AABX10_03310 [Nanoarchaeota archaeon]